MNYKDRELNRLLLRYYRLLDDPGSYKRAMGFLMQPHEVLFLYGLVLREQPDIIFESGTALGWSASWMALASKARVITYDPVDRDKLFNRNFIFVNDKFSTVRSDLSSLNDDKKLFLIDGDHTKKGLLEDFCAIEEFLRLGDIVVLHDIIREGGVRSGFKKIQNKHPNWKYELIRTFNGIEVITVQ